jgi:hypothetical protein
LRDLRDAGRVTAGDITGRDLVKITYIYIIQHTYICNIIWGVKFWAETQLGKAEGDFVLFSFSTRALISDSS